MDYHLTIHASDALAKRRIQEKKLMILKVDHEADALNLSLSEAPAVESEEVAPGVIVDFSEHGQTVGIEMLHLSTPVAAKDTQKLLFETVPLPV